MNDLKKELLKLCVRYVQKRIDGAVQAINATQQAANEETKSSAGDKYETGRAMMQQETDRNQAQLNEANKLMVALNHIRTGTAFQTAETGSLVITNNGKFFIAIGAGTLMLNGENYFAVSPASPIGLKLKTQKIGDEFSLNGKIYRIENII
ncbi:MAG: 3-oxoacyl-ACP synthase [Mucilaginibacter sp.]|nr:3-oxoacyl-ACP synthase [Mucilaginibacter sp.]